MRQLGLITLVISAQAAAMPLDFEEMPERAPRRRAFSCPPNTEWGKLARCLQTQDKLAIVHEFTNAKLIRLQGKATVTPTIVLYMRVDGTWVRTSFAWNATPESEVLGYVERSDGTIEIDAAYVASTSIAFDQVV